MLVICIIKIKRWGGLRRLAAIGATLLVTSYCIAGEVLPNLCREVLLSHVCWGAALALLWAWALASSLKFRITLLALLGAFVLIALADWNRMRVLDRMYLEANRIEFERIGWKRGDECTNRNPFWDLEHKNLLQEHEARLRLVSIMKNRESGWCHATAILARNSGVDIPRVINWDIGTPVDLCGYYPGWLPFPALSHARARLRIERELLQLGVPLRERMIQQFP